MNILNFFQQYSHCLICQAPLTYIIGNDTYGVQYTSKSLNEIFVGESISHIEEHKLPATIILNDFDFENSPDAFWAEVRCQNDLFSKNHHFSIDANIIHNQAGEEYEMAEINELYINNYWVSHSPNDNKLKDKRTWIRYNKGQIVVPHIPLNYWNFGDEVGLKNQIDRIMLLI